MNLNQLQLVLCLLVSFLVFISSVIITTELLEPNDDQLQVSQPHIDQTEQLLLIRKSNNFMYENCGSDQDPLKVHSLNLLDDSLVIPGNVSMDALFSFDRDISGPIVVCYLK